jgi:hypothetical protein
MRTVMEMQKIYSEVKYRVPRYVMEQMAVNLTEPHSDGLMMISINSTVIQVINNTARTTMMAKLNA